jgi:hypothetical protein
MFIWWIDSCPVSGSAPRRRLTQYNFIAALAGQLRVENVFIGRPLFFQFN